MTDFQKSVIISYNNKTNQKKKVGIYYGKEINKKTVVDFAPEEYQADEYRALAKAIDNNKMFVIPKPMTVRNRIRGRIIELNSPKQKQKGWIINGSDCIYYAVLHSGSKDELERKRKWETA